MKSEVLTLLLLTTGAFLFQSTHQYRIFKRELTEYDLTKFIVNTCSAEKVETIIQNLCDQTLQSALMGNFPFLTYYCKTIGVGMRYCGNLNQQTDLSQSDGAKRFVYRRFVRSLNEDSRSQRGGHASDIELDLEQKRILQMCLTKSEKSSIGTRHFCNEKLQEAQRGRYPEVTRLCKSHPAFAYCQRVLSYSPSFSWPLSTSSSLSLSTMPNNILSSIPSSSSAIESVIDHHRINNKQKHPDQQIDV
jgi:hypothetical protein